MKWYTLNFEHKMIEDPDGEWGEREEMVERIKVIKCPFCQNDDLFGPLNGHKGLTFCNECRGEFDL